MLKSILLSVDGSEYTDAQVKHATDLARAFAAHITVLSVVDVRISEWAVAMGTDGFVPMIPSNIYKEESQRILKERADAVIEKCTEIMTAEQLDFSTEQVHGAPADVICEKSRLVDMLMIGARGEFAKWKKNLVGATLDAVVRQWSKPVLITQKKYAKVSAILSAYDGSDRSNKALQLAALFAAALDCQLTVLTVHDNVKLRQKFLNEAKRYLAPHEVAVDFVGSTGNPEKEIIRMSHERSTGLIIMGAFGQSRIREAILGSTTEYVIRHAEVPVLLSK